MERLKWWWADARDTLGSSPDAKLVCGIVLLALLASGGYVAATKVADAGTGTDPTTSKHLVRLVTTVRVPVKVRVHGHTVIRWRVRRKVVRAQAQTVMQKETVQTPSGTKVITKPVVHYRVAYKKKVVKVSGKGSTVVVTNSRTDTVSRTQTDVQTVTRPVTVVQTQTVVTTVVQPGTTVTLPGTTVTVTLPATG